MFQNGSVVLFGCCGPEDSRQAAEDAESPGSRSATDCSLSVTARTAAWRHSGRTSVCDVVCVVFFQYETETHSRSDFSPAVMCEI